MPRIYTILKWFMVILGLSLLLLQSSLTFSLGANVDEEVVFRPEAIVRTGSIGVVVNVYGANNHKPTTIIDFDRAMDPSFGYDMTNNDSRGIVYNPKAIHVIAIVLDAGSFLDKSAIVQQNKNI